MRAGRSVSQSFITADGCAGHPKPQPGPGAVTAIPSVSLNPPSLESQMAAHGVCVWGGWGYFQTSSLAQLAPVSCRQTPAASPKFDYTPRRRGRRGLRVVAGDVKQVVLHGPWAAVGCACVGKV